MSSLNCKCDFHHLLQKLHMLILRRCRIKEFPASPSFGKGLSPLRAHILLAARPSKTILDFMDTDKAPRPWELLSETPVADCKVFKIVKRTLRHPDGRTGDFYVNRSADWVQVAALSDSGDPSDPFVLLVNQYRFGSARTSWEFPGGIVEAGEPPEAAAARELLEETGYAGGRPRLLASYSPNPALHENLAHFVVIENCRRVADPRWDSNEEIQSKLVRASGLWPMVKSGEIYHSIAINCAFFLEKFLAGGFGGNAGGGACR